MAEQSKGKLIGFWIATGLIVVSQFIAGVMDLIGAEALVEAMKSLGYPTYTLKILGTCKILGVIAIAAPGLRRMKEWAYAGFTFDFLGAAASHALNGDAPSEVVPPMILLAILLTSYFLSPPGRKI